MRFLARTAIALSLGLATVSVNADPVSFGALSSNDDGSTDIIVDTLNGYEWLRWDVLGFLTYEETLAAIAPGGDYEGWNLAGRTEAQQFMDALLYPGPHNCTVDGLNGGCGYAGQHELSALLGDSFVPNSTPIPSDVAFFLSDLDPERPVGFVEHSLTSPQTFFAFKSNAWSTFTRADSYPLSGEPIPWLLYREPLDPADLLDKLFADSTGVGPGKSLANKVTLAQTYYSVPDVPATCAVLSSYLKEVKAQTGKKLTVAQAATLSGDTVVIMLAIACE